ncbi:MAG TPA: chemotaxis protein CheB [Planctomycetota bacterium]|nr:chemotaxis protein CheB [Planctomycetota bacterium]
MKILIVEDDDTTGRILELTLGKAGHDVRRARDGAAGFAAARAGTFDALIVDWMMPGMDGLEVVRRVRSEVRPAPLILMVTAIGSHRARRHALEAGADDYLEKPCRPEEVLDRLQGGLPVRRAGPGGGAAAGRREHRPPPFAAVGLVASTGGAEVYERLFAALPPVPEAAFLAVLHGADWVPPSLVARLADRTRMHVALARDGEAVRPGEVRVAPGSRHLVVDERDRTLRLVDAPPENYARPAGDPLFRSLARAFGRRAIAVVLTGIGRDGAVGCEHIAAAGGRILVQDPARALAPSMPATAASLGFAEGRHAVDALPAAIAAAARECALPRAA